MQELLLSLAEDGVVTSAFAGQSLRLAFGVQRKTKEMTFARIGTAGDDDRTIGFVEIDESVEIEIDRRNRPHERAIGRMQLDLPRAIALGCPKKLAAVFQPHRHRLRIEIQPDGVLFPQQLAGRAGGWIDREQDLLLLRAILDEQAERRRGFLPDDAREVGILLAIPLHPARRSAGARD